MHPIEWLRVVARSGEVPHSALAGEAAAALAALADDPAGLLLATRRLLDRHRSVGALWWACARMVAAGDGYAEAGKIRSDLASEQLGLGLTLDLPDESTVSVLGWSELAEELASRRGDLRLLAVADGNRQPSHDEVAGTVVELPGSGLGGAVSFSDVTLLEAWAVGGDCFLAAPGSLAAAATAQQTGTQVWLAIGVGRRLPDPLFEELERRVRWADSEPWLAEADVVPHMLVHRTIEPIKISCPCPPELLHTP